MNVLRYTIFTQLCLAICQNVQASFQPASTITTTQFSDDEKQQMGEKSAEITSGGTNLTKPEDTPLNKNHASALWEGLKEIPPPKTTIITKQRYDPVILDDPDACERNYELPCPEDFNFIGDVNGNNSAICAPSTEYDGPCSGSTIDAASMSLVTKRHWEMRCKTNWPCKMCTRRIFSHQCPLKWAPVHSTEGRQVCSPTVEYSGPCTGYNMDFAGFNIVMKQRWSDECRAWWPCSSGEPESEGPDAEFPVTKQVCCKVLRYFVATSQGLAVGFQPIFIGDNGNRSSFRSDLALHAPPYTFTFILIHINIPMLH